MLTNFRQLPAGTSGRRVLFPASAPVRTHRFVSHTPTHTGQTLNTYSGKGRGLDDSDEVAHRSPPQNRQQDQEQQPQLPYDRRIDHFQSFRSFQQSSPNTGSMSGDADSRIYPIWYRKLWPQLKSGWYSDPQYTVRTLYAEILRRCEQGESGCGALFMICKLAKSGDDARMVLSAVSAVRTSAVRQQKLVPFKEPLAAAFVKMTYVCDATDVLVEALHRTTELGLTLSGNRVLEVTALWGDRYELAKVEMIIEALPAGGLMYNTRSAYILIRACTNCGQHERAQEYARLMQQQGVRLNETTLRLLAVGLQEMSSQPPSGLR